MVYFHYCLSCTSSFRIAIYVVAYIASTITTAKDIVVLREACRTEVSICQLKEFLCIFIVDNSAHSSLSLGISNLAKGVSIMYGVYDILKFIKVFTYLLTITLNVEPCSDVTVLVSLAVPKPFTAIYLHLGVAENAGIGAFVLCILLAKHLLKGRRCCRLTTIVVSLIVGDRDIAIATTKDVESEHTAFDMHKSITINNTVGATTIYTVPYHRSDTLHTRLVGIGNM